MTGVPIHLLAGACLLAACAGRGVDTRRNRIAIPQPVRDRVEFWELPG